MPNTRSITCTLDTRSSTPVLSIASMAFVDKSFSTLYATPSCYSLPATATQQQMRRCYVQRASLRRAVRRNSLISLISLGCRYSYTRGSRATTTTTTIISTTYVYTRDRVCPPIHQRQRSSPPAALSTLRHSNRPHPRLIHHPTTPPTPPDRSIDARRHTILDAHGHVPWCTACGVRARSAKRETTDRKTRPYASGRTKHSNIALQ